MCLRGTLVLYDMIEHVWYILNKCMVHLYHDKTLPDSKF